ncbi:hypothetical protein GOBAR_AA15412 [Gossypium barbadense]|uniref:Kinesin-like protein n=1 Tax=Gossypium barbadense TaxID=3634 RepID=A0A2P5XPJ0_GOSBA|nr:hypothetical protein GOBAR_AA15412 [Gossypium barbadense]
MASNGYRNGTGTNKGAIKPPASSNIRSSSFKSRLPPSSNHSPGSALRRTSSASFTTAAGGDGVPGRVRVAVRLRPRNAEESTADADFADCVELQPELKRLKLRKNNWESETYEFDEVLTEFASQKRVYEVVAKPVVESVLDGYNGTVMAYGQTGTGKTFTLGRLGEEDTSARGIMLYMETIQDLLDPANDNISIVEDPRTGDVSLPGATHVEIKDEQSFLELLRLGEAHRIAANTKLNTESSRSHAILMVHVKRSVLGEEVAIPTESDKSSHFVKPPKPLVRKSKLVLVDLAGSERVQKSGSEGHMLEEAKSINLSLSALGKCINALAENSAHVPIRDSKLTRLLRDSFGGTARTSLIVTIGPSPRHRGETASTILFGQRAMKVENMLRIKEEFDYKSLARRLEIQLDKLIAENERQQKAFDDEVERINLEAQNRVSEVERNFTDGLEKERLKCQMEYMESVKKLEEKMIENQQKHQHDGFMKDKCNGEAGGDAEILKLQIALEDEVHQKKKLEEEIIILRSQMLQLTFEADQMRRCLARGGSGNAYPGLDSPMSQVRDSLSGHKTPVSALFDQVGVEKILDLLESEDANVRIHAVKVVANLAAEEANQERIVEAGGLTSLLMLLRSYEDETVRRVAAGAIANLAMNAEANQELIMVQGGISLLSTTASDAEDPQTLRMVAGAIANLCGNDKLQATLRSEGGIKALLGMVRCRHPDVLSQVARGIANFAKCESRASTNGIRSGRSLLIDEGALPWIVQSANNDAAPIRRHIELALCHLAQHEANAKDMINGGALWELVRITRDCSREDIRSLARRTLNSSLLFRSEMRRLRIEL